MTAYPGTVESQARVGVDKYTGKMIYGWNHCLQCINTLIYTHFFTRVMRLEYGSDIPRLVDSPMTPTNVMRWYVAIDTAIRAWEPGYRITTFNVDDAANDGSITITLDGLFYPRGHLGDYSIAEQRSVTLFFGTAATGNR